MNRIRYEGNEILKTDDQNNNGDYLVTNFDEFSYTHGSTMIIEGLVVSQQSTPDMSVQISRGTSRDNTLFEFLSSEAVANLTINAADGSNDRYDTIEIRRYQVATTPEIRQFKDPTTLAISQTSIDTVNEYKTEVKVLAGTPGSGVSASAEVGWIKIAEVLVPASSTTVVDSNIYNVDAVVDGGTNSNWTNDQTSIFRNGSNSEVKTDIYTKGVPEHSITIPYGQYTSFVQDEGMVWGSLIASNLGNLPSTNQDKWSPAYAPTEIMNVSASGSLTIGFRHYEVEVDLSAGAVSISTLPLPKFIGQKVHIYGIGSGVGDIGGGTGLYANGVYFTENTGGVYLTAVDNSGTLEWRAGNGVTADYVSGTDSLNLYASGKAAIGIYTSTITTSSSTGSVYSGNSIKSFPITLSYVDNYPLVSSYGDDSVWTGRARSLTTSQVQLYLYGATNTQTGIMFAKIEGKY